MEVAVIVQNLGYLLIFVGLAVREILPLRLILLAGHLGQMIYGLILHHPSTTFWNGLFGVANTLQILLVLHERSQVKIPPELLDLFEQVFAPLTSREFMYFWEIGYEEKAEGPLTKEGEPTHSIMLILKGQVEVIQGGKKVALLSRGDFFGEMSYLTGGAASADVIPLGDVDLISWTFDKLSRLKAINPPLFIKIQGVFGKDLAQKIQRLNLINKH